MIVNYVQYRASGTILPESSAFKPSLIQGRILRTPHGIQCRGQIGEKPNPSIDLDDER